MKIADGMDLQQYGVAPGRAYGVVLPQDGGGVFAEFPLSDTEIVWLRIAPETWAEIERDGLALMALVCLSHVPPWRSGTSHPKRIALYRLWPRSPLHE